ncbi:MAG: hypothetical protein JXQ90_04070 [Cyclobacteriaceae bacterium]
MKKSAFSFLCLLATLFLFAQDVPSPDWQVRTALLAAPEEFRMEASVLGYDSDGKLITLREGTNKMICLADDPTKEGFSAASYFSDLEPFMTRGRQLKMEGKSFKEIFDTREEEVKSGKLKMPDKSTLIVMTGEINPETKEIENQYTRYVFYIPFATPESTGLPAKPLGAGHPWIMDPGTHRAHIMLTPERDN